MSTRFRRLGVLMFLLLLIVAANAAAQTLRSPDAARERLEIQSRIQTEAVTVVIGITLVTIATVLLVFAFVNRRRTDRELLLAGLFAGFYGVRALAKTATVSFVLGDPGWIRYLESALEYLIPIPASVFFASYFGKRYRSLNRIIVLGFVAIATIAIPYEFITRRPNALIGVENAMVMLFMIVYAINLVQGTRSDDADRRLLRIVSAIFGLAVVNEHLQLVRDRFGVISEATAFLIFVATIILIVIRQSVRATTRLASVDGELQAARKIQASILPRSLPQVEGVDVATAYLPASDVAGDYYEFVSPAEGELGVLVADVSGHGIAAALVASMLKIGIATLDGSQRRPAELLERMNRLFCGKLERQFITAAYVHVSPEGLRVGAAGHPPPLVFRASNGSIEEIAPRGAILGRFPSAVFEDVAVRFDDGDVLVLYTDGVTEARNAAGEIFGDDRLGKVVEDNAGASADRLVRDIRAAVSSWSRQFEDDVTLVVLRRVAVAAETS